jgi:catechol 2,3-dioxygenase-like lactoylglutathione lyase family enzyme
MKLAISMISLGISNLPESVAFYRDKLNLELQGQHEGFAFFKAGPVTLLLNVPLGNAVQPRAGATEIIFPVAGVRAAHADLVERGCKFANSPRLVSPGSWAATFTDPDGHRLTLFGPE